MRHLGGPQGSPFRRVDNYIGWLKPSRYPSQKIILKTSLELRISQSKLRCSSPASTLMYWPAARRVLGFYYASTVGQGLMILVDGGRAPRSASGILPLSGFPRFLAGCCVVVLSVSLAAACSGRGSPGPSNSHSSGGAAKAGTYKRSAHAFSFITVPAGQGGGTVGPPRTVVTRKVAWRFSDKYCKTGCSDFRLFIFKSTDGLPLDATIKITGAPNPPFEGGNGQVYCPKVECFVEIGFYPVRDGHWTIRLNIDSPHFHARYQMPAEASSFR